ncbi:MAG: hypothetical protein RDU25_00630 [Patescibacteria group bacterium]|nr:hypothetical protein [Patescibacteria group bacterium]
MKHFLVLGTHPELSLAEISCVLPENTDIIRLDRAAVAETKNWEGDVMMNKLGGVTKLGDIVEETTLDRLDAGELFKKLKSRLHDRELNFGWTVYGGNPNLKRRLTNQALVFKKIARAEGLKTRWVTGKDNGEISPAAIFKMGLTSDGMDICIFVEGTKVHVGVTTDVQDPDAWSLRDFGRPARNDVNGMLPPKLARIMVNLAQVEDGATILDPFCGSGTILMETALATKASLIIGSDISDAMMGDTLQNQEWLIEEKILRPDDEERFKLFTSDVRRIASHLKPKSIDCIITEGYLGKPLKGHERQADLENGADEIRQLWIDSLKSLKPLLKPHARLVCVWPQLSSSNGRARVDLTHELSGLGYVMLDGCGGQETSHKALVYQRPGQHVSRRVVILENKV